MFIFEYVNVFGYACEYKYILIKGHLFLRAPGILFCTNSKKYNIFSAISIYVVIIYLKNFKFQFEPLVAARASCGYVGLKNAGATCYMNSVIQQLYMLPGVKESVLFVDENQPDEDG